MNTCPYCEEPLDHGTGGYTNGLHDACNEALNVELNQAFPELFTWPCGCKSPIQGGDVTESCEDCKEQDLLPRYLPPVCEPPLGTWASVARIMAQDDDSGFDWDAWKDEMKERELA